MSAERRPRKLVYEGLERKIYASLRADIVEGAIRPGSKLVEAAIAEEFGVSKTPAREALIRLQRDGLVEITPYRGARVVQLAEDDVLEVCELRLCIECYIARDLAQRRPADVLAELRRSIDASRARLAIGDVAGYQREVRAFSRGFADSCGNRRMAEALRGVRDMLDVIGSASLGTPGRAERSIEEHDAILDAINAGNVAEAEEAVIGHVRSIERDSLAALKLASDGGGESVE
jgi:DNA-binding GntR family transcriptional regulator